MGYYGRAMHLRSIAWGSSPHTPQITKYETTMQYNDAIGTMNCAMNGTTMCVAAIRELWAKPANGDSFPVHSIVDETETDNPWYTVYVTDYKGNRYDFCNLSKDSQNELCDFVIDELY